MKVVYASRTGNVEAMIGKLGIEAERIDTGDEVVSEPFILMTYTDGYGDIPAEVEAFLENGNAANMKGVIASGDTSYGEAFCGAGNAIAERYGVEHLYHFENDGTDEDVAAIAALIK